MITVNVDERESAIYTAVLQDVTGAFPSLSALSLTLYDKLTNTIINARDAQPVLNANNVTYNPDTGEMIWELLSADNAIVNPDQVAVETHIALFVARYNTNPLRVKPWEIEIIVKNLGHFTG